MRPVTERHLFQAVAKQSFYKVSYNDKNIINIQKGGRNLTTYITAILLLITGNKQPSKNPIASQLLPPALPLQAGHDVRKIQCCLVYDRGSVAR